MIKGYSNYYVDIRNEEFLTADGRRYAQTAVVTLFDQAGEDIGHELLGCISTEDIFKQIGAGLAVCLDSCYVKDLSLSVYRKERGMERKELVELKGFSARGAFFEAQGATDLSYAGFPGGGISFEGSHFARGRVQFGGSVFGSGEINFSDTLFRNGNIEFTGCIFGEGDFLFKNTIVKDGIKDFQDVRFGKGEVTFANTEFNNGDLLFINSRFSEGKVSFKVARIAGGRVDFHYSVFGDCDISFERAEFGNSRVDFRAVDFGTGKVNFNRALFGNGELSFEGASCSATRIQFKRAEMGSGLKNFNLLEMEGTDLSFERTEFGYGDVTFYESRVKSLSLKSCHLDHYFDLRLARARHLDITDTIARDIIDIEPYDFPVDIRTIDISGMRLLGKLYIDWTQNKCEMAISEQEGTTLRQKAEQFRILKENFSGTGKYDDEDRAYVMFKRFEARSWLTVQKEKGGIHKQLSYIPHVFKWLIFDKIGLYATSPWRVLLSVMVFWFLFGFLYYLLDLGGLGHTISASGNPDHLPMLIQSFYHSAVTFFTIGYGDVYPVGFSRLLSGFEGFTGVFMMSYFTVAFVRKVLR